MFLFELVKVYVRFEYIVDPGEKLIDLD